MDYKEYRGKSVDDAITNACQDLLITSDKLDYEVIEKGSSGFLGIGSKDAVIKARVKGSEEKVTETVKPVKEEKVEKKEAVSVEKKESANVDLAPAQDPKEFLNKVFEAMNLEVDINIVQKGNEISIDLAGPEMGVLIGKRGQTLDSLQYLTSLVVNKGT